MTDSPLRYDRWIEEALRGVVRKSLDYTVRNGLPGEHHFYLSFRTDAEGVHIAPWLKAQYPEEMTIVLQHKFIDLEVDDEGFAVTLSFGGREQRLRIPFSALTAFNDPSVNFGLQLRVPDMSAAEEPYDLAEEIEIIDDLDDAPEDAPVVEDLPQRKPGEQAKSAEGEADAKNGEKMGEVISFDALKRK